MFQQLGQKKPLSQQVEEQLLTAIRNGTYRPGQRIPTEFELCKIFNVSRTAIREALKKMSARGIIDVRKGSGAYVSEISVKSTSEMLNLFFELSTNKDLVLQTIETRQMIEPILAARAAKHRNENHLASLRKNMEEMRNCDLEDKKTEAELDNNFHHILLSVSNNPVLELLFDPIFSLMPKFKTKIFAKPTEGNLAEDKEKMLVHHQNIVDAIVEQNERLASERMTDHLLETRNNYMQSIQKK